MRLLGQGWQYTVYDLGNGRVLKQYNTKFAAYCVMLKACFPFTKNPLWELPKYYRGCKQTALDSIEEDPKC